MSPIRKKSLIKTKKSAIIAERNVVLFKPSKELKFNINQKLQNNERY